MATMKAVVYDRYGPPGVLRIEEVERPEPGADEVLVRIRATTVNRTDTGLRNAEYFISRLVTGLIRPKNRILGMEFSGEVEAIGSAVSLFKPGDQVFGGKTSGAHAQFLCIGEEGPIAQKPVNARFEEAAPAIDGASLALACLRTAGELADRSVLIHGASGAVGSAGVQLAKYFRAHVTAVTRTANVVLARSLGADEVVDYTAEDWTRNGKKYDVIFDAIGKTSYRRTRRSLNRGGTYVDTDLGFMWHVPLLMLATRWSDRKVKLGITRYTRDDLLMLKELMEAGQFRAVIDRTYPLEEVVEATRYVETGQKTGNVVLTVS